MAETRQGPPEDLDPDPENQLVGRQPYHYPHGPEIPDATARRSRIGWMVTAALLLLALVVILTFIIDHET